ncbi:unnamed protein product [Caenorhabditis sp. 36 PRJEB53466]|nr:unnamed protein product [Caenorhabditis sp. 36 PRJEB53466]
MFRTWLMTSEPSTSSSSDRNILLQEALTQAGVIKIQKQCATTSSNIRSSTRKLQISEKIISHPLMPIVELLFKKCEDAVTKFDKKAFEMEDVVLVS